MQKDPNGQSNASDVFDCVFLLCVTGEHQKENSKRRLHRLASAYVSVWADKYDPLRYIKGKYHCRQIVVPSDGFRNAFCDKLLLSTNKLGAFSYSVLNTLFKWLVKGEFVNVFCFLRLLY